MENEFDERNKWVIIEITERLDGQLNFFFAPDELELPSGFLGNIIWYVFTPGWELHPTEGVVFPDGSSFQGHPQPDATRARCWSTPTTNEQVGTFPYTVNVHRPTDAPSAKPHSVDPVVENDPPPTFVSTRRITRRGPHRLAEARRRRA